MQYKFLGNLSACLASQMVVNLRLLQQRIRSPSEELMHIHRVFLLWVLFSSWWYSAILLTLPVHLASDNNTLATFPMDQL